MTRQEWIAWDRRNGDCTCEKPKSVTVTEESFGGLFMDTPATASQYAYCDRCLLQIPHAPARPGVR
jgi:hypothetical protein